VTRYDCLATELSVCLQVEFRMKRVIEGVTYNTDTATVVARWEYKDQDDYNTDATLYRTRGGAFFIVHEWTVDEREKVYFEASTREQVQRLVERTDNLAILDEDILADPPEAAEEASPSATLYVRLPTALKDRLDVLAKNDGLSVNAWAMRCVERCANLEKVGERLGEIMQTGLAYRSDPDGFLDGKHGAMISHMHEQAEEAAKLLGWRGKALEDLSTNACYEASLGFGQSWRHYWKHAHEDE
jgi:hypothetical protein